MEVIVNYIQSTGEVTGLSTPIDRLEIEADNAKSSQPKERVFIADIGDAQMDCSNWYVKDNALVGRKTFDLVSNNGVISGIPIDTTVLWPDGEETVESEEIEFDSNVSGLFPFRFTRFTHFTLELEAEYNV